MLDFSQVQLQKQTQILSQKQIQALHILQESSDDLINRIHKEAEKNPALKIKRDFENIRETSKISSSAQEASDKYLDALESAIDYRESLQEHLISQFNLTKHSDDLQILGEKIIYSLNKNGFLEMDPSQYLSKGQTKKDLEKIIQEIQQLDPVGTCTLNTYESIYVQAKYNNDATPLTLFLLDGRFETFLNPPDPQQIAAKVKKALRDEYLYFGKIKSNETYGFINPTPHEAENSLNYIRTLDPFPGANFSSQQTQFISADVLVEKISKNDLIQNEDKLPQGPDDEGYVVCDSCSFRFTLTKNSTCQIELNQDYVKNSKDTKNIRAAKNLIEAYNYRISTLQKATYLILKKQIEFFNKGAGHLEPFTQRMLAQNLEVHEATVSRLATGKYLEYNGKLYEFKKFFSNQVSNTSKDKIILEIKKIIQEAVDSKKQLSDQKISEILLERGIKISRRTVSKYRNIENISNSYKR